MNVNSFKLGNHEEFFDFSAYRYRFEMPTPQQNIIDGMNSFY